MEVDDIISYHDVVTAENWGEQATRVLETNFGDCRS